MKWLLIESPDSIKRFLVAIQVHSHSLAICQVIRCLGGMRRNYARIMSKENRLELHLVGDEWMLFDEKKNTLKIHTIMLAQ
jgi:hypothetical protein